VLTGPAGAPQGGCQGPSRACWWRMRRKPMLNLKTCQEKSLRILQIVSAPSLGSVDSVDSVRSVSTAPGRARRRRTANVAGLEAGEAGSERTRERPGRQARDCHPGRCSMGGPPPHASAPKRPDGLLSVAADLRGLLVGSFESSWLSGSEAREACMWYGFSCFVFAVAAPPLPRG
jgi:hypothetical protein